MSRTVIQLKCENPDESEEIIQNILKSHKYELTDYDGEVVYKKGIGYAVAPKYIKYTFEGNKLTLEAWVASFGSPVGDEDSLDGFVAKHPKKSCRKVLDEIQNSLNAERIETDPSLADQEESHTLALALGLAASIVFPLLGIIVGIYLLTREGENAKKYGGSIIVLSIVLAVMKWFIR